jgi:hypothetical protein
VGLSRRAAHLFGASVCTCLVVLLSASTFATAGQVLNACGPGLEHVKAFKGHASFTFDADAQGDFPGTADVEVITMQHNVLGVDVALRRVEFAHGRAVFEGRATGGGASVTDVLTDESSGFGGALVYSGGSLSRHGRARGHAALVFNRHRKHCVYAFGLYWSARADYNGAPEEEPSKVVGGSSLSAPEKIPDSLKLSGDQGLPTYLGCFNGREYGCSDLSGGWTTDFGTLALCHSVVAVGCEDDETTPVGAAQEDWFVKPVYEK